MPLLLIKDVYRFGYCQTGSDRLLYGSQPQQTTVIYFTFPSFLDSLGGHIGHASFEQELKKHAREVTEIQADGDELVRCCRILGRDLPPRRVHTFIGDNAKEIALNW